MKLFFDVKQQQSSTSLASNYLFLNIQPNKPTTCKITGSEKSNTRWK